MLANTLQSLMHIGFPKYQKKFYQDFFNCSENITFAPGEMAEWSNAAVLKTVVRVTGPGVRIPLSPPTI